MSQRERTKLQLRNFFSRRSSEREARVDVEENNPPQYRLQSREKKSGRWFCCDARGAAKGLSDIKPNERLAGFLHWMFRANVLVVIFFMSCIFFLSIYAIAGIIYGAAQYDSECVRVGGEIPATFADAFQLSWTTFSTVSSKGLFIIILFLKNVNHDQRLIHLLAA